MSVTDAQTDVQRLANIYADAIQREDRARKALNVAHTALSRAHHALNDAIDDADAARKALLLAACGMEEHTDHERWLRNEGRAIG